MKMVDRLRQQIQNNEREFDRLMNVIACDDDMMDLPTLNAFHGVWVYSQHFLKRSNHTGLPLKYK